MKRISCRVCLFALLALMILGHAVQAAPEPPDPLPGDWLWFGDVAVTINADGTTTSEQGTHGTWTYQHNPQVQRHYRVVWNQGRSIDDIVLAEDSQRARVRNDKGAQFDIRRALTDKPAATPAGPGPAVVQTAPANDPLPGDWVWRGDFGVTIKDDGTFTSTVGMQGAWTFLKNSETERKYRLVWEHGLFIDEMVCSRDGRRASVRNQKGDRFDVHRAIPDKPAAGPTPVRVAAGTANVPAVTTGVRPANEPAVGNWLWLGDLTVTFNADGTLAASNGSKGTWTYLNNPEAERKYRLIWEHGKYIDDLVCSRDGQRASVRNQNGQRFDVRRALPDKVASPFGSTSP